MTFLQVRDAFVNRLGAALGRSVILHDQTIVESEDYPIIYYQPLIPWMPRSGANRKYTATADSLAEKREELTEATISLSVVSYSRELPDGGYIFGEDEALEWAERAMSYLIFRGREELQADGIAVMEVTNVQNRSAVLVDDVARQYGFDVRLRYRRTDTRPGAELANGRMLQD